ncbi:MAG: hypothetical protein JNL82_29890 [Myxococcales bacterium]|nr:hypothetical protein [Myxococcales bacterium]
MARTRPPQHRADVPGVFILRSDGSFDRDRYDREVARMTADGVDRATHPIERYYAGATRYDLQATEVLFGENVRAGDYFRGEEPERFILRRLDWEQWHRVMALIEGGQIAQAQLLATRMGVVAVENSTIKLAGAAAGMLTHDDMQRLFDADSALPSVLGFAVWRYSRPLTETEKKA